MPNYRAERHLLNAAQQAMFVPDAHVQLIEGMDHPLLCIRSQSPIGEGQGQNCYDLIGCLHYLVGFSII